MKNNQTGRKKPFTTKEDSESEKEYDKYEVISEDDKKYYSSKEVRVEKIVHKN